MMDRKEFIGSLLFAPLVFLKKITEDDDLKKASELLSFNTGHRKYRLKPESLEFAGKDSTGWLSGISKPLDIK